MTQYQRLLVMLGPQMRHTPALQRAAALADTSGAALDIIVCVDDVDTFGLMSDPAERKKLLDDNQQWLADEWEQMRRAGLDVACDVILTRDLLQTALDQVNRVHCDLLIKDVQHEPTLKRLVNTPLDWQLLRECPVPIHLVSEIRCPLPRLIAAAVDLIPGHGADSLDDQVIEAAHSLALQCDAELHLVHVFDTARTHLSDFGAGTVTMPGFTGSVRTAQHKAFDHLADRHSIDLANRHFLEGPATRAITAHVNHSRTDVMVMGNRHHDILQTFMGDITAHVTEQQLCNVLAVKASVDPLSPVAEQ
ncbi:universal stress protein [Pseudomonas sp. R5(2019)]|uniref:universal stress protein n=1 Tax=Pseudomonas sp. R5(2019) TaxID=2697566 RepID=UPI001411FA1A|nr:universal stress protein [Pseudomonas sp. R5(2019)]NBA94901.1 universal stress protein [Pseudomonas sp. R5(2019)]